MTVEEFFEWQQRQDRNYELVDGLPILHKRAAKGSHGDLGIVMRNISKLAADWAVAVQTDERLCCFSIPEANLAMRVISPWHADFDIAQAAAHDLLSGRKNAPPD